MNDDARCRLYLITPPRVEPASFVETLAIALDAERLIHANAHHMAVTAEPFAAVAARITAAGGGPVIARRRLTPE